MQVKQQMDYRSAGDTAISQVRYHQSTLPSTLLDKLRWMPKMWLHHHIDFVPQMEHKCSEFEICSLRLEIAACHLLKAPFSQLLRQRSQSHPSASCQLCKYGELKNSPKRHSFLPLSLSAWDTRDEGFHFLLLGSLLFWYHEQQRHGQRGGGRRELARPSLCEHDGPDSREWDVSKNKGGREKEGERGGRECAEQAGTQENEWINSLPTPFPLPPFPKALGFITKHAELVGTNRLYKHP